MTNNQAPVFKGTKIELKLMERRLIYSEKINRIINSLLI